MLSIISTKYCYYYQVGRNGSAVAFAATSAAAAIEVRRRPPEQFRAVVGCRRYPRTLPPTWGQRARKKPTSSGNVCGMFPPAAALAAPFARRGRRQSERCRPWWKPSLMGGFGFLWKSPPCSRVRPRALSFVVAPVFSLRFGAPLARCCLPFYPFVAFGAPCSARLIICPNPPFAAIYMLPAVARRPYFVLAEPQIHNI